MPYIKEPGKYAVTVISAEDGTSQNGTPFVGLSLVTDNGLEISHRCYFSDKSFEFSLNALRRAFGFDGDFENLGQLVGKRTEITVELEEYNGKDRAKVKYLSAKPASQSAPVPKSLSQSLTARAKTVPVGDDAKPTPPPARKVEAVDDNEPF